MINCRFIRLFVYKFTFLSPGATPPPGFVIYSPLAGFSLLACKVS